jgi:beta-ureidopropionase
MNRIRIVRAAMTQTINAFPDMPADLRQLEGRLEEVRAANVAHHLALVAEAKQQGVKVICFGELFPAPYFALSNDPMWLGLAEDAHTGKTISTLREVAQRESMIIIAPIYELAESGRRFNTAVVIDDSGEVLGTYRKTHIPHGSNEQGSFLEGNYYERSNGENLRGRCNISKNPYFPVWETSVGKIGVAICYDRHFEGVMWSLAHAGAELIFSPAVTFGAKSERMWHLEFQVDAARHNVFIGGSNRKGIEPPWNQPYFGESHFTGPNGVLKNQSTHENLIIADVDLGELKRPDPSGWNLPRDTRYDIYSRRPLED